MKSTLLRLTFVAVLVLPATSAWAAGPPGGAQSQSSAQQNKPSLFAQAIEALLGPDWTGQPGVECGAPDAPNRPGQAAAAPGSAFNPDGKAGKVYAGEQPQNSKNTASVSQYDAACAHVPSR